MPVTSRPRGCTRASGCRWPRARIATRSGWDEPRAAGANPRCPPREAADVSPWLLAAAIGVALYATLVLALLVAGRRSEARAVAGFIPDCLVLMKRLLTDPRVPRRHKLALALLVAYLAMPFDLVPDFIPVAGQLDDAVLVALVLRLLARRDLVVEHWSGPPASLAVVLRMASA